MKSAVTDFSDMCFFCGRPATQTHHLIFGQNRKQCDKDRLFVPICDECHTMGNITSRIHDNAMAEKLSKMLGQALYERNYYKDLWYQLNRYEDEARQSFTDRYGRSFL